MDKQNWKRAWNPRLDRLTGLYTKGTFLEKTGQFLAEHPHMPLCMVCADLDHFSLYNQCFGRQAGDRYLCYVAARLRKYVRQYGGVAGYAGNDNFYYLCPDRPDLFATVEEQTRTDLRSHDLEIGYAPKIGIFRIEQRDLTVMDLCDRARQAMVSIQEDYSRLLAWYDASMERRGDELRLIRAVESGLRSQEFTFFLQPKCNMRTGKLVGAEALVRWVRQDGETISPGIFVPPLENSGLISRVGRAVWEDVCR